MKLPFTEMGKLREGHVCGGRSELGFEHVTSVTLKYFTIFDKFYVSFTWDKNLCLISLQES